MYRGRLIGLVHLSIGVEEDSWKTACSLLQGLYVLSIASYTIRYIQGNDVQCRSGRI